MNCPQAKKGNNLIKLARMMQKRSKIVREKKGTTFIHRRTTNLEYGLSKLITQPILCTFIANKFMAGKDWEKMNECQWQ